jgi:two-component system response regulator AtoC
MSPRQAHRFVAVNCGAIPEALLESELFGHVRGAFTGASADQTGLFEEADGGTLLLDEIGDLPLVLQVKLLRVLQEHEIRRVGDARPRRVDVRVIAATARELETEVRDGRFREDLYYRLNVVRIHVPPLRERPEDLDALVEALLRRAGERSGRQRTLAPGALAALRSRPWPGNVRELENAIERATVLSPESVIQPETFAAGETVSGGGSGVARPSPALPPRTLKDAVTDAERQAIEAALAAAGGNRSRAAELLGVSQRNLFYKLRKLGLG